MRDGFILLKSGLYLNYVKCRDSVWVGGNELKTIKFVICRAFIWQNYLYLDELNNLMLFKYEKCSIFVENYT